MNRGTHQAVLLFLLLLVKIAEGGSFIDGTQPVDLAQVMGEGFDEGSLPGAGCAQEGQIANLFGSHGDAKKGVKKEAPGGKRTPRRFRV